MKIMYAFMFFLLSGCACNHIDDDPLFLRHDKKDELKAKIEIVAKTRRQ